jgi:L-threonylcarbamoyladenylate synthase
MDAGTHSAKEISAAVAALRRGEVIGLPTETVYGLAADATNPSAVRRIFELKGRPADHPLIVHLAEGTTLEGWAEAVPRVALKLAERFWPGPLTLILKRGQRVSDLVTGGQDTVGIRVPSHPLAQALLQGFGGGLAAPSANRFGRISPTCAQHVRDEFGASVPLVLDGGECQIGIESTIVDLSGAKPRLLRPGVIEQRELEVVIGPIETGAIADSPRAPGMLAAHYAPSTPLQLVARGALAARVHATRARRERVLLLTLGALPTGSEGLALPREARAYGHALYAALRELDAQGAERLLIERPPNAPEWIAILDRLQRAAAGAGISEAGP